MPRVFPFEALVYDPAVAGPLQEVTAPPYDVISEPRRREFLEKSEFSVVHLDLAEGSEDPSGPGNRYARAAALVADWIRRGALVHDPRPSYYAYEMRFVLQGEPRTVRGLMCAMELEAWGGRVIPHELTMPGPVADRLRLLRATRTHLSAVYGTVEGPCPPLAHLLHEVAAGPAGFQVIDGEGVEHRMWRVPGEPPVMEWLKDEQLLIADGHHRYTTALHNRDEEDAARGPGPWDRVLTFVVDARSENLPVLPFHRVQEAGRAPEIGERVASLDDALARLSDEAVVVALASRRDEGVEHRVVRLSGEAPAVRALHEQILDGIAPAGSLRYLADPREAEAAVEDGSAVAAWFLPSTTTERIRKVVERGERLPQKSTYFWPKPRTGMIMMPIDG